MMTFTEHNDETQAELALRSLELAVEHRDRVITEYAADACAELCEPPGSFTKRDHAWVRQYATTLAEVDKATLRLVALRTSRNMSHAATRLGIAPVSLSRWLGRRDRRGSRR